MGAIRRTVGLAGTAASVLTAIFAPDAAQALTVEDFEDVGTLSSNVVDIGPVLTTFDLSFEAFEMSGSIKIVGEGSPLSFGTTSIFTTPEGLLVTPLSGNSLDLYSFNVAVATEAVSPVVGAVTISFFGVKENGEEVNANYTFNPNGDFNTISLNLEDFVYMTFDGGPHHITYDDFVYEINQTDADAPIPEPATLSLLGMGLASLAFRARRRDTQN